MHQALGRVEVVHALCHPAETAPGLRAQGRPSTAYPPGVAVPGASQVLRMGLRAQGCPSTAYPPGVAVPIRISAVPIHDRQDVMPPMLRWAAEGIQ